MPFSHVAVPLLETERLLLRGHRLEDFADCAALWADPQVTHYIGGQPLSAEDVWARLLRYVGHWAWLGYGYWAVEVKRTGQLIGELGFADFHRNLDPPLPGRPEIGWVLASSVHGRGFATEGVQAAVAWGDQHVKAAETFCLIHPHNFASVRVAQKCGYTEAALAVYKGQSVRLFIRKARAQQDR